MAGSSEEGQVIGCHTVEAWTDHLQKGNESKKLVRSYYQPLFVFLPFVLFVCLCFRMDLSLCYGCYVGGRCLFSFLSLFFFFGFVLI